MKRRLLYASPQSKGLICYSFLFILLLNSCSKSDKNQPEPEVEFQVLEHKSNMPLPGVAISFYKCSKYDNIFGCQQKAMFSTTTTDANGRARVSRKIFNQANQGVLFLKPGYFTKEGGAGTTYMHKEVAIPVLLTPRQNYLSQYKLFVFTQSDGYQYEAMKPAAVPSSPLKVTLKIINAQQSVIHWEVREIFGGIGNAVFYDVKVSGDQPISLPLSDTLLIAF